MEIMEVLQSYLIEILIGLATIGAIVLKSPKESLLSKLERKKQKAHEKSAKEEKKLHKAYEKEAKIEKEIERNAAK